MFAIELGKKPSSIRTANSKPLAKRSVLEADVVFKAIGQKLADDKLGTELQGLKLERGKIVVDESQATSIGGVWAGGDCVIGGDDLTVSAVQHGKIAAIAIDRHLKS